MPKQYALDSEYRNRWQNYCLADGTVYDSRLTNWRQVPWDTVVEVATHMVGKVHIETNEHNDFKFFLCFRWGGREPKFVDGKNMGFRNINIWTVGWTDGEKCYLTDIDFYLGNIVRQYTAELMTFKSHIHPAAWKLITKTKSKQPAMMG